MSVNKNLLQKVILIASFRRSGTHLTIDSLINNTTNISKKVFVLDQLSNRHESSLSMDRFISKLKSEFKNNDHIIIKTHQPDSTYPIRKENRKFLHDLLNHSKKVYVTRDGRDVMVSLWYYLQTIETEGHLTLSNIVQKYSSAWEKHITWWLKDNVYTLKYEDWHHNYETALKGLFKYLGLLMPLSIKNMVGSFQSDLRYDKRLPLLLKRVLRKMTLEGKRLTAVEPRSGKMGEWKQHFSEEDKYIFKQYAGDMLIKLEYEIDDQW